jgi:TetR/AcrR family transcriptional repressor of nem operon
MARASVREQLIASAVEVFHSRGFNGCSVQDIVDAAGVPKGSFYNHFDSKEALGVEVVRAYTALVGAYVVEAGAADILSGEGTPLQRIRAYFEAVIEQNVSCGVRKGCLLGNFAIELAALSTIGALPSPWCSLRRRTRGSCRRMPTSTHSPVTLSTATRVRPRGRS